jgi:hypothetical protein
MFQGTQDARDHGWSIRSVCVADPDGPRRVEQAIRLLLCLSAAGSDAEDEPVNGGDDESSHLRPRINRSAGTGSDD